RFRPPLVFRPFVLSCFRVSCFHIPASLGVPRNMNESLSEREWAERRRSVRLAVPQILAQSATLGDAAPWLLQAICECLGWDLGLLWTVDRNESVLRCLDVWHPAANQISEFENASRRSAFAPGIGLPGRVWTTGAPAWIP